MVFCTGIMLKIIATFSLPALLLGISPLALAHHSFAADFDYDRTGTVEGVVSEVFFRHPHVQYYVTVTNEAGEENLWATATMSPNSLVRWGWSKDTVKRGDKVIMHGNLGRRNSRALWIRSLELEDGRVIKPTPGGLEK
jgi:hypothetical protein